MNRNRIQKRILSVILTAALVFSGTGYGNLSVVSAKEDSTEETLLVEETEISTADGNTEDADAVTEETDSAVSDKAEIDTADADTETAERSDTDAAKETDTAVEETVSEEIQTVNAAERDAVTESSEEEETEEETKTVKTSDSGTCGAEGCDIQWEVAGNVLRITGSGRMKDYTTGGLTTGSDPAPWPKIGYDKIEIGEGVTYIGTFAFEDGQAKEISIANTVTEIGEGAFISYGSKWELDTACSIELPTSIKNIRRLAFKGSFFKTIIFNSDVCIEEGAFWNAKLDTVDITFSDGAAVEENLFQDCQSLKSVTLRGNISAIKQQAFLRCRELATINIPDATPDIEDCEADQGPFNGCAKLTTIDIPNGFKDIGTSAFSKGISGNPDIPVTSIKLSDKTQRIGRYAFNMSKVTGITIPKSVTTMEEGAFYMSAGLETVTFEARDEGTNLTIGSSAFGGTSLISAEIPDDTEVEGSAFSSISTLKKVAVGSNVNLGTSAFGSNTELEEIIIGKNVILGESAFAVRDTDKASAKVVIGDGCTLGKYAFRNRYKLTEAEVGKNVTIPDGNDPFNQCNPVELVLKLYKGSDADTYASNNGFQNIKYFVQQVRVLPDADGKNPREIAKGAEALLEIELLPDTAETKAEDGTVTFAKQIEWQSSDDSIVTISNAPSTAENKASATIQAVGAGTCTVTVICDGIEASCGIKVLEPAADVTASPESGTVIYSNTNENTVALACATEGAVIYYTTDGSEPSKNSKVYDTPVIIDGSTDNVTVKAFASAEGYIDSAVSTFDYPVKKKAAGIVLDEESLTLGTDEVRRLSASFTPDGAEPEKTPVTWSSDHEEIASVTADTDTTKAAVTAKSAGTCTITATCGEFTASCEVTVTSVKRVSQVTAEPSSGEVVSGTKVLLVCETERAVIYYTTDGSTPTEESTRYEDGIVVSSAMTIQAVAVKSGYENSAVATFEYTIKKEEIKLTGIALDKDTLALGLSETGTLQVNFEPENAVPAEVTWASSDASIASVQADAADSAKAKVSGLKAGSCTVTATCGEFTASCEVTVKPEEEQKQVSAVKADPAAGEVLSGTKVSLTCETEGAQIYYTLDDTTPTKESSLYQEAIAVNQAVTIKAVAVKEGYKDSEISTFVYTVKTTSPIIGIALDKTSMELGLEETGRLAATFQPSGVKPEEVQWRSDQPEIAEVTADTGDAASARVTGKKEGTCTITVSCGALAASCKVTVRGIRRVSAIIAEPSDAFAVTPGTEVTLHCDTAGASIYYTMDGTVPTTAGTPYTGAIMLDADTTLRAVGVKEGYEDSPCASFYYTVNDFVPDLPETEEPQEGIWITDVEDQPYTGSAIKPSVYVYDGKKLLKEKTDYTISYKNNKNVGSGQITVTGKGNYANKRTVNFNIVKKNISDTDVIIEDMAYAHDKKAHKTTPVITHNGRKLKAGKDFEVTYDEGDYTETGSYDLTITGIGSYTGTAYGVIKIVGKENLLGKAAVASIPAQQYNKGNEITLADNLLKVTLRGQTLEKDKDYVVSYLNNVNPGKASVILKGIGAYAGTKKATFKIVRTAVEISKAECRNAESFRSMEFVKGGCMPCPILVCDGDTLREGTDYTVSYKNNKKAGAAATLTVRGKGNFKSKMEIHFDIAKKDISKVSMYTPNVPYTGKANKYQSKPILVDADGTRLKAGTDYTLTYTVEDTALDKRSNPEENTVITVQVDGKGNYSGSRTDTYVLKGTSFTAAKISILNKNFTGRAVTIDAEDIKTATIKTKSGTVPLTYGVDYEVVSYSNNTKKGTATVVFCGIGEYAGEKSVKFKIVNKKM